jgi:2,3-bisphosphoglycerate-independent phosphoglycerate mutase
MKRIVILTDGASDYPDADGDTPLGLAKKPNIDALAVSGEVGLCRTVPDSLPPGSDVANLSVMGFDPALCYTGRSPLEAAGMGIKLNETDKTYRLNLVTLSGEKDFEDKTMSDYSGGEIDTESAKALVGLIAPLLPKGFELFPGVSYRHCLIERNAQNLSAKKDLTPPHDITDKKIAGYLPSGEGAGVLLDFMKKANEILSAHPSNRTRANAVWIWGEGTKPALTDFKKTYGLSGAVISAVDLVRGIAVSAGMDVISVPGATGTINTDFDAKAAAALTALKTHDYVYLHLEAPDECGHQGDRAGKIKAIELIDEKVVGPVISSLRAEKNKDGFKILILPDHATPLKTKTHARDPVPYILYDSKNEKVSGLTSYTEAAAKTSGNFVGNGYELIKKLL